MHTITLPHWLPSPSQHFLIVALALLIYVVNARARQERRSPTAAISWVMGLALVPYLMLPLYLAFGQRKLPVPVQPTAAAPPESAHWAASLLASFGLDAPAPAAVRFHADGRQSRDALWQLIDGARESLDICVFLVGNDAFGRAVLARLAARVRAGVRVRLMYDGMGHWVAPRRALRELAAAGAQIAVFRPLLSVGRIGPRNLRNHRKLAIADQQRLWAGGRNLAAEYFTGAHGHAPWLDLSFDLDGPVAVGAARQFAQDWVAASGRGSSSPAEVVPEFPVAARGALAQFLPSGPDQAEDTAHALLVTACFRAQHRLLAITPYFVPDASLQQALRLAARRGVKVTLVVPAVSNHQIADFVRGRPLRELAQAGARILLLPVMSHAKAVVVDDTLAVSGSFNLDSRSLLLNYECAVVFYGAEEIRWLAEWIDAQTPQCAPFDARPPGLLRDIAEGALLAVAFQV
jgi:cardiolipin synthase